MIEYFLQDEYEGEMDCTLVSIMTIIKFFKPEITDMKKLYLDIKAIPKKFFYTDNLGTQALFINYVKISLAYFLNITSAPGPITKACTT